PRPGWTPRGRGRSCSPSRVGTPPTGCWSRDRLAGQSSGMPMTDQATADLVAAAAAGDELAWEQLVRRYTPLVFSVIRSYDLSGADAADVNQTVWLRLVESLPRLRDPSALAGWLSTTARRECFRALRAG